MEESSKEIENSSVNILKEDEIDSLNPKIMLSYLLPLLSKERIIQDHYWLDIVTILYNIYEGNEEGLNILIEFSKEKRTIEECINFYKRYKLKNFNFLSFKTIAYYARQDDPENYTLWHNSWINEALDKSLNSGEYKDLSQVLYRIFWLDYLYNSSSDCLYEFRNFYFYNCGKFHFSLDKKIMEEFTKIYQKIKTELSDKVSMENEEKIKSINGLLKKLSTSNYRKNIINSCKELFLFNDFEKIRDKNIYLTGLKNCILEIVNEEKIVPRLGKPEDFITRWSSIEYPFDYTQDSENVKLVNELFDKITLRNEELKKYFFKRFASYLKGHNHEKKLDLWIGDGNKFKSIIFSTLCHILGSYCVDFPISLLSGKAKQKNPEIIQANNSKLAIMNREYDNEELCGTHIVRRYNQVYGPDIELSFIRKYVIRGDRMICRAFYHLNPDELPAEFYTKTLKICKKIPDIFGGDYHSIHRFGIFPFLGAWSSDAPEDIEEQFKVGKFKIDEDFESKISNLAKGLLWIMVQYYPIYATEKLEFPKIVEELIEKHFEENNPYKNFLEEKLEYVYKNEEKTIIDKDVTLKSTELYVVFTKWFKEKYPDRYIRNLAQVKIDLCLTKGLLGPQPIRGCWLGIRLKE